MLHVVDDSRSSFGLVVNRLSGKHRWRVDSPFTGCRARYLRHQSLNWTQNSIADSALLADNFFCGRLSELLAHNLAGMKCLL